MTSAEPFPTAASPIQFSQNNAAVLRHTAETNCVEEVEMLLGECAYVVAFECLSSTYVLNELHFRPLVARYSPRLVACKNPMATCSFYKQFV